MKKLLYPLLLIYRKLTSVYWQIAITTHTDLILDSKKINILNFSYQETNWFADPFIFDVRENEIDVIAEEYLTDVKKGVISLLTIKRADYTVLSKKRILELDTHLSFPFVFRENGKTFFFPENSASGVHSAYELSDALKATNVGVVVTDPLVDTAIIKIDSYYYLFGSQLPEENGNNLRVYKSESLLGRYELCQEITVNKATARGASGIYQLSDKYSYYRIAQDNEGFYGRGLVFQEIKYNPIDEKFSVEEKYRRYPNFEDRGFVAMHTYNVMGDIAIIDVKKYRYPFWGKFVNNIRYRK